MIGLCSGCGRGDLLVSLLYPYSILIEALLYPITVSLSSPYVEHGSEGLNGSPRRNLHVALQNPIPTVFEKRLVQIHPIRDIHVLRKPSCVKGHGSAHLRAYL